MIHLIAISLITILLIYGCIYSYNWNEKQIKNAQKLFDEKLIDLCHNAKTIEECNYAWNELMNDCLDGNLFKIPRSYQIKFYELRSVLQGKLSILNS